MNGWRRLRKISPIVNLASAEEGLWCDGAQRKRKKREKEKSLGKELEGRERGRNGAHRKPERVGSCPSADLKEGEGALGLVRKEGCYG